MAFCKNCGNQIPDGAAFCANCGTPADNTQQTPQQPIQPDVMNSDGTVLGSDRGLAWLAYVPWAPLFLIPLFVRKRSDYCQFHVKQGATLWAVQVAYEIIKVILLAIIRTIPLVGRSMVYGITGFVLWSGSVFLFVLAIIGIVNAATGKKKELPLIGMIPWVSMLFDKIYASLNK